MLFKLCGSRLESDSWEISLDQEPVALYAVFSNHPKNF